MFRTVFPPIIRSSRLYIPLATFSAILATFSLATFSAVLANHAELLIAS